MPPAAVRPHLQSEPAPEDRIVALLGAILAEQRATRLAVERLAPAPRLGRLDLLALRPLLATLADAYPDGAVFTVADALACDAVRVAAAGRSAKALGKLLARANGVAIGDAYLERLGTGDTNAVIWCVRTTSPLVSELSIGLKPA